MTSFRALLSGCSHPTGSTALDGTSSRPTYAHPLTNTREPLQSIIFEIQQPRIVKRISTPTRSTNTRNNHLRPPLAKNRDRVVLK